MSDVLVNAVGLSTAAGVVVVSGVLLTRRGWPFGVALLSTHKLIALAAVVFIGYLAFGATRTGPLASGDRAILAASLALCIAIFATGGVVSAIRDAPTWAVWTHRAGSWFCIAALTLSARVII